MDTKTIGNKLKYYRKQNGLTQQALADEFNIKQDDISRYENDKQDLNLSILRLYCRRFGVSADYLLGLAEIETNDPDVQFIHKYTRLDEKLIMEMNNPRRYPSSIIRFLNKYCHGENKMLFADLCFLLENYKYFLSEYNRAANIILSHDEQSISRDDIEKLQHREDTADLYEHKTELCFRELIQKYAENEISESKPLKAKHHAISYKIEAQIMDDIIDSERGEEDGNNQETQ